MDEYLDIVHIKFDDVEADDWHITFDFIETDDANAEEMPNKLRINYEMDEYLGIIRQPFYNRLDDFLDIVGH